MDAAIKAEIVLARIQAGRSIGPERGPGPTPGTPERLAELHGEIRDRPWRLATRHLGDDPSMTEIHRFARVGAQPVGTDANDMNLHFYLPAVRLRCPGPCNSLTTFTALASSTDSAFGSPYPRKITGGTEQIFTPVYRCEMCRKTIYTILVRRVGLRLHLCGFAPRREPLAVKSVPDELLPILNDAEQAVAEGDLYAGFYHLCTMLEHYLKGKLAMPITLQICGDELAANYHEVLEPGIKGVLPSIITAWEKLSAWLHTRTGEAEDYQKQRDGICKHIEIIVSLGDAAFTKRGGDSGGGSPKSCWRRAVITTPTVLVLGAGASYPYGFPTARGLKELICEQFSSTRATASRLLSCLNPEGSKFAPEEFSKFREAFLKSGQPSVDAFLHAGQNSSV